MNERDLPKPRKVITNSNARREPKTGIPAVLFGLRDVTSLLSRIVDEVGSVRLALQIKPVLYELAQVSSTLGEIRDELREDRKRQEDSAVVYRVNSHAEYIGAPARTAGDFFLTPAAREAMFSKVRNQIAIISVEELQTLTKLQGNKNS